MREQADKRVWRAPTQTPFAVKIDLAARQAVASSAIRGDLILIGGLARQGKSIIAAAACDEIRRMGLPAGVISLDRWIVPARSRTKHGILNRFDLDEMQLALAPWLDGGDLVASLPVYDRTERTRIPDTLQFGLQADGVLLLEGVPALLWKPRTHRRIIRVYIKGDEAARRGRMISDLVARGIADQAGAETIYEERQLDEGLPIEMSEAAAGITVDLRDL